MSLEEYNAILSHIASFGIGAIVAGIIIWLFLKNYFPSYLKEKAQNLAKVEDIEKITTLVEEVKHQYSAQIQELVHQNNLLLEQAKSKHQLRLAAVDKRLQAHQEAFELWRKMISNIHSEKNSEVVLECQDWYNKNCLYLDPDSRVSFLSAYGALHLHPDLLHARSDVESIKTNFSLVISAGEKIVKGAELPSLGKQEIELMTEGDTPNKLNREIPESGATS